MRLALLVFVGCGRIGFDSVGTGDTALPDQVEYVPLIPGGKIEHLAAPPGSIATFYAVMEDRVLRWNAGVWTECAELADDVNALLTVSASELYAGSDTDVMHSTDGCASWQSTGLGQRVQQLQMRGGTLWATGNRLWRRDTAWTEIAQPFGSSDLNAFALDATGTRIYIAERTTGVAYSSNSGASWTLATNLVTNEVQNLAVDPADPLHVFCAATDFHYESVDGGASWTQLGGGGVTSAIDSGDPNQIVFSTWYGIFTSSDGGTTWDGDKRAPEMHLAMVNAFLADPQQTGHFLAGTDRGLFESTDYGTTWNAIIGNVDAWQITSIASHAASGTTLLATEVGVLRTTGISWVLNTNGFEQVSATNDVMFDPSGRVLVAGRNLLTSDDGGVNYTLRLRPENLGMTVWATTISQRNGRTWLGMDGVSAHSDDLVNWTTHVQNLDFRAIGLPDDQTVLLATNGGIYVSTNAGMTFQQATGILTREVNALVKLADGTLLAGTEDGVWRATGDKTTWEQVGLDNVRVDALLDDGPRVLAATTVGLRASTDLAAWEPVRGLDRKKPISLGRGANGDILVGTEGFGLYRVID